MKEFWKFIKNAAGETELRIEGEIANEESWWYDTVTPRAFRDELDSHDGDIVVWINSIGGDVFAGSAIYTALIEHHGKVTVKIDGIAASAASVIAMAGDKILMSPTATMMIHNPSTIAIGDSNEMKQAAKMLDEVRGGLVAAYVQKTGKSSEEILALMDDETWMNAESAVANGFADGLLEGRTKPSGSQATMYSRKAVLASAQSTLVKENRLTSKSDQEARKKLIEECQIIMQGLE